MDASAVTHEARPVLGTAYSAAGWNTNRPANLQNPLHYPMTALCDCGEVIGCEEMTSTGPDWKHTGRMPGEQ